MFYGIEYGNEDAYDLLRIRSFDLTQLRTLLTARTNKKRPCKIPYTGPNRRETIPSRPKSIVTCGVSENQHQAHNNGEGGDDGRGEANPLIYELVEAYHAHGENGVEQYGDYYYVVDCAFGEAQDERYAPRFCARSVGEGVRGAANVRGHGGIAQSMEVQYIVYSCEVDGDMGRPTCG